MVWFVVYSLKSTFIYSSFFEESCVALRLSELQNDISVRSELTKKLSADILNQVDFHFNANFQV